MDRSVFERMTAFEEHHWWFAARRKLIHAILTRCVTVPENANILEAGCGTDGNLALLREFGNVDAFEFNAAASDIAEEKSGMPIVNKGLYGVFASVRYLIGRLRVPAGLSYFAVLQSA